MGGLPCAHLGDPIAESLNIRQATPRPFDHPPQPHPPRMNRAGSVTRGGTEADSCATPKLLRPRINGRDRETADEQDRGRAAPACAGMSSRRGAPTTEFGETTVIEYLPRAEVVAFPGRCRRAGTRVPRWAGSPTGCLRICDHMPAPRRSAMAAGCDGDLSDDVSPGREVTVSGRASPPDTANPGLSGRSKNLKALLQDCIMG